MKTAVAISTVDRAPSARDDGGGCPTRAEPGAAAVLGPRPAEADGQLRTRDRVLAVLQQQGTTTTAALAAELELGEAAIRRHLDSLEADGLISRHPAPPPRGRRRRGRPAASFELTEAGRARFGHTYDNLATAALEFMSADAGAGTVERFAEAQVAPLEARARAAMARAGQDPLARAQALADVLSAEGYAASAHAIASGGQVCQHHCPVAHVAARFPQLCDAETAMISRLLGTHVQRLATIANGDGVCTTHVPRPIDGPGAACRAGPAPTINPLR